MKKGLWLLAVAGLMVFSLSSFMPAKNVFTAAEQQQVSIATPGLFAQSQAFNVDFGIFLPASCGQSNPSEQSCVAYLYL